MAKNKSFQTESDDSFDFSSLVDENSYESETLANMVSGIIQASHDQMVLAVELTKLAIEKNSSQNLNEEQIFSTFKRACNVISESSPLKDFLKHLETKGNVSF
jgi:hypothetical protein